MEASVAMILFSGRCLAPDAVQAKQHMATDREIEIVASV